MQPDSPPQDAPQPDAPPPAAPGLLDGLTDQQIVLGAAAALFVGTFLLYGRTLSYPFVNFDDPYYVTLNPEVAGGLTAANLQWAWTTGWQGNWHPLTWMSLQLDASLFGTKTATGFRAVNILLHAANAALLYAVLMAMTGAVGRSAVAAALWAAHPLHVESVVWITERKDVLSTLFWLLATWTYVCYAQKPSVGRYLGVVALMAAGLTAKAMLVTLPFALLLLDYWPLGRTSGVAPADGRPHNPVPVGRLVLEKLPLFALAAASSIVTFLTQQKAGAVGLTEQFDLTDRLGNGIISYVDYLRQTLAPVDLGIFYPYSHIALTDPQVVTAAGVLFAFTGLAVAFGKRYPYLPVGWLWFVGTLVPVVGLVQIGMQARADRYTYVPHIGLFVAAVWGVNEALGRATANTKAVVAGVVLLLAAAGTYWQTGFWKTSEAAWARAVAVTSGGGNAVAEMNLGGAMIAPQRPPGQVVTFAGIDPAKAAEAVPHFAAAVKLDPKLAVAQRWLGVALTATGRKDEALAPMLEAARLDPADLDTRRYVAALLFERGRIEESVEHLTAAEAPHPDAVPARVQVGKKLLDAWKIDDARDQFDRAVAESPTSAEARLGLGISSLYAGKVADAEAALREAVRLNPKLGEAHAYLGAIAAHAGRWPDAVAAYEKAAEAEPNRPPAQSGLGMALTGAGRKDEGRARYLEAARLDPSWPVGIVLGVWPQVDGPTAVPGMIDAWAKARQGCEMTEYKDPRAVAALAAVRAAEGNFKEAEELGRKAALEAERLNQPAMAKVFRAQLDRYRAGKALRD